MPRTARRIWRIAIVIGVAAVASACGRRERTIADAFQWSESLPAGTTLHLRNNNGTIRVRPATSNVARVVGAKRWRFGRERDVNFVAQRRGNDVYVCALWRSSGRCDDGYRFSSHRMFRFFSIRWGTDTRATLTVDLPPGVKLDARTTTGSVDIQGARAGGHAQTVNGSILMKQSAGSFELASVNGSITAGIDSLSPGDTLSLETVNGSVRASLPSNFDGGVSLSTVNGSIRTQFPVTTKSLSRNKLQGKVGESTQMLRAETVNGVITLSKGP